MRAVPPRGRKYITAVESWNTIETINEKRVKFVASSNNFQYNTCKQLKKTLMSDYFFKKREVFDHLNGFEHEESVKALAS